MSIATRLVGKLSFAHLASRRPAAASASAEGDTPEDEDKKPDAESDEPDAEDDDKKPDAKGAADTVEDDGEDDDGQDDKASAEHDEPDGDEDPDKEMRGNSPIAAARRRERARCAAIFASAAAGRNPVLAAKLAFNTAMPRDEALAVLEGTPAPAAAANAARAARNPQLGVGGERQTDSRAAAAAGWDKAFAKYTQPRR